MAKISNKLSEEKTQTIYLRNDIFFSNFEGLVNFMTGQIHFFQMAERILKSQSNPLLLDPPLNMPSNKNIQNKMQHKTEIRKYLW